MVNITLSMEQDVYKRMKEHSEIKWSEFVSKAIKRRLDQLDTLQNHPDQEVFFTMLASESVLKQDWDNSADEMWNHV